MTDRIMQFNIHIFITMHDEHQKSLKYAALANCHVMQTVLKEAFWKRFQAKVSCVV